MRISICISTSKAVKYKWSGIRMSIVKLAQVACNTKVHESVETAGGSAHPPPVSTISSFGILRSGIQFFLYKLLCLCRFALHGICANLTIDILTPDHTSFTALTLDMQFESVICWVFYHFDSMFLLIILNQNVMYFISLWFWHISGPYFFTAYFVLDCETQQQSLSCIWRGAPALQNLDFYCIISKIQSLMICIHVKAVCSDTRVQFTDNLFQMMLILTHCYDLSARINIDLKRVSCKLYCCKSVCVGTLTSSSSQSIKSQS